MIVSNEFLPCIRSNICVINDEVFSFILSICCIHLNTHIFGVKDERIIMSIIIINRKFDQINHQKKKNQLKWVHNKGMKRHEKWSEYTKEKRLEEETTARATSHSQIYQIEWEMKICVWNEKWTKNHIINIISILNHMNGSVWRLVWTFYACITLILSLCRWRLRQRILSRSIERTRYYILDWYW